MRDELPRHPSRFRSAHPEIYDAFEELGRLLHETGSLSERDRRLVKLGIAIGVGAEGGVHSAVRQALAGGCSREDVEHAVRLAITTVGWPRAMAALSWITDARSEGQGGARTAERRGRSGGGARKPGARRGGGR
jgi:alkylhydroperoxidase/carboxymuconolactone decarboxylase family protein YurZ